MFIDIALKVLKIVKLTLNFEGYFWPKFGLKKASKSLEG